MDIFIEKHIPVGAGLGGGSADAAAVLTGLNQLFQYRAGILELLDAAAQLGSDVSFCLVGGTKITQKRGEAMTSVPSLPRCSILICPHICRISTKWAYAELDRLYGNQFTDREDRRAKIHAMLNALKRGELSGVTQNVYNIFEEAIFPLMPEVRETRDLLLTLGADTALMSGSGSSVFGIFTSTERAWDAKYRLETAGRPVCLCHPI